LEASLGRILDTNQIDTIAKKECWGNFTVVDAFIELYNFGGFSSVQFELS
jgi:hypothetical protein